MRQDQPSRITPLSNNAHSGGSLTRRQVLASAVFAAVSHSAAGLSWAVEPDSAATVTLRRPIPASYHQQVKVLVSVAGELRLNPDGKEVKKMPLKVEARLAYTERLLPEVKPAAEQSSPATSRWLRSYSEAEAKMQLQETPMVQDLRSERKLLISQVGPEGATLFSPLGPLTREELELVEVAFNSSLVNRLLPAEAVSVGSSWKISNSDAAALLGLENVTQQDVALTLTELTAAEAKAEFTGKVTGLVGGITSEIELHGKWIFEREKQALSWLSVTIDEDRAIGHAQPGYKAQSTLKMVMHPVESEGEVSDDVIRGLPQVASESTTLIDFHTDEAGFDLAHDRRWRVMVDRKDLAVLRLVDRGDLVAQCNVTKLPALPKGSQLTLEGFQADVRKTLGSNFKQITEAGQSTADSGLRVLRVTVLGVASELPIQWTYYHLSDSSGNRVALVVTLEGKLAEKYPGLDKQLISGFQFFPIPASNAAEKSDTGEKPTDKTAKRPVPPTAPLERSVVRPSSAGSATKK